MTRTSICGCAHKRLRARAVRCASRPLTGDPKQRIHEDERWTNPHDDRACGGATQPASLGDHVVHSKPTGGASVRCERHPHAARSCGEAYILSAEATL